MTRLKINPSPTFLMAVALVACIVLLAFIWINAFGG